MTELNNFSFWFCVLTIAVMMGVLQGMCAYLILLERKMAAWMQDRVGPNRAGPFGLLQPIADGLKFLLKEEVIPKHVDRVFYLIAPAIAVGTALFAFAVVPFGPTTPAPELMDRRPVTAAEQKQGYSDEVRGPFWSANEAELQAAIEADRKWADAHQTTPYLKDPNDPKAADKKDQVSEYNGSYQYVIAPNVNIGFLFVFAVGSLAVYGVLLGGWSSNNKYSVIGSLRASAQMISYEIPLGMAILGVFLVTGSLNMEHIIQYQIDHGWNVLYQPLACILFITAIFAECNRVPFDLPEAEQEIVAGYHTEYSGMKFALFFLGEYTHMITTSFIVMLAFFGGWHFPGITGVDGFLGVVLKIGVFAAKMAVFILFYMLIRWTIPRFRFDQLMSMAWKGLIPITVLNMVGVMLVKQFELSYWLLTAWSFVLLIVAGYLSLRMPKRAPAEKKRIYHRFEAKTETISS